VGAELQEAVFIGQEIFTGMSAEEAGSKV